MTNVNVLVVDDFQKNLVATEAILARPGLTVLKASSGIEALEMLLNHDVALALFDVRMPEMNGFELAELMRGNQRTREIPIIFMTASNEDVTPSFLGYQSGAVDFLTKPVNPEVLRGKVEVFVQLHAQKARIAQQLANLREALQVNEMFVAVLGHDLRTPLSAVLHGAEVISRRSEDAKIVDAARRIWSAGSRMDKMVRQLLDVARLRAADVALYKSTGNCVEVTKRIVEEIEHDADASRIRVMSGGDVEAMIDVDRIAQVLANLIGNALQHGDPGVPVEVDIDGWQPDKVILTVRNAGAIPPDILERIFTPFYGGDVKRASHSGLGLGLYIVKQFVEAHQGSVTVRSTDEGGTSFVVTLPRGAPVGLEQTLQTQRSAATS